MERGENMNQTSECTKVFVRGSPLWGLLNLLRRSIFSLLDPRLDRAGLVNPQANEKKLPTTALKDHSLISQPETITAYISTIIWSLFLQASVAHNGT